MKKWIKRVSVAALCAAISSATPNVFAQADAAAAFADGKAAFAAGKFADAAELFQKASQTDNKNPEVFLWLGKSQYQLGHVEPAVAAWVRTQALAPQEPYSAQMLKTLRGEAADAVSQLALAAALLNDELPEPALAHLSKLLAMQSLTDAQRANAMTLEADGLLRSGHAADAEAALQEVLLRYPKQADANQIALLRARVQLGQPDHAAAGIAALRKLATDRAATPVGVAAQLESLAFDLEQNPTLANADALAKWIAAHPDHLMANRARRILIDADLALTRQSIRPTADAVLTATDKSALAAADELIKRTAREDQTLQITRKLVDHFKNFYGTAHAYAGAIEGAQTLLNSPLGAAGGQLAMTALAEFESDDAVDQIADSARAGKLAPGPMPKPLADAVQTLNGVIKLYPADSGWAMLASVAQRVHQAGLAMPLPAQVTELRPADRWAMEIALPIVKTNADSNAVDAASKTMLAIADETQQIGQLAARELSDQVMAQLVATLSTKNPHWPEVARRNADALARAAEEQFADNIKAGKPDANAKLSDAQSKLVTALADLVAVDASQAPGATDRLATSLRPWVAAGYTAVAEEAYATMAKAVPPAKQRQVQLAIVRMEIDQALADQQRLAASGLAEPRKLDPALAKALQSLWALQAGVDDADPFLAAVRAQVDRVVDHYKLIKYFDVAELAANEKGPQPSAAGQTYQQYLQAVLEDESARRAIDVLLAHYKPTDKLVLTDGAKSAIQSYEQFITAHPADPLARQAVDAVLALATLYEQQSAFDVAATIDRDFSTFAAKTPTLAKSAPGRISVAEQSAFAAVLAQETKARAALTKLLEQIAESGDPVPKPPGKISDDYAAAITAYKDLIKAYPHSPLVRRAISGIRGIALEYARSESWEVADGIYAGLLADNLASRSPERIDLRRGLCQIGKVMPEHAKEVLAALEAPESGTTGRVMHGLGDQPTTQPGEASFADADAKALNGREYLQLRSGGDDQTVAPRSGLERLGSLSAPKLPPINGPAGAEQPNAPTAPFGAPASARALAESQALAAISQQEQRRASQIARIRDGANRLNYAGGGGGRGGVAIINGGANAMQQQALAQAPAVPTLSPEELTRQQSALDAAQKIFQSILADHAQTPFAERARNEILVEISYWRSIDQGQRAAAMGQQFLKDNPLDRNLPSLRLAIATDHLAWASQKLDPITTNQQMLAEVTQRFTAARRELTQITTDFPDEHALDEDAQWQIANSFLTQARTVDLFSATLARGQYVRAAKQLQHVAELYARHPRIGEVPQMLWGISQELHNRGYHEDAITVWNILAINYPTHDLAGQAQMMMAQTYQTNLGKPLRAAEVYSEINFTRGGNDPAVQQAVFAIGSDLKNQKRWIEALRVLEGFVQSFPKNQQAGEALAMIGQIHQANEAWQDAIAAYRRVIDEFPASAQWVQDAKWSIADCTINLSKWKQAIDAYESYVASFPKDQKVGEANRRISILKDLANYQKLVDENGPKAYDAQFQIATIVQDQLGNWRKAVEEFQKVATNWPKSHLASDALHSIGMIYLANNEVEEARTALRAVAANYPDSPYACDSLYQIGKSYEDEAARLATVTRAATLVLNGEVAQKRAYAAGNSTMNFSKQRLNEKVAGLRSKGKQEEAELQVAENSGAFAQLNDAQISITAQNAFREQEDQTAEQLADRQDKINAALRKAVAVYNEASKVPAGDKAGEALLHMAEIYNNRLGDSAQAMATWLEIARQFSGTAVAEEASWQIAQHYEKAGQYAEAVEAYKSFLRNYRRSPKAPDAQFFIAENYEHLGQWINAMDQYTSYVQNFPEGALVQKAKEQVSFIKTYRL
jgi:TolA-binding protein